MRDRERVNSGLRTFSGAKPCIFLGKEWRPWSPKEGLCFRSFAARLGKLIDKMCMTVARARLHIKIVKNWRGRSTLVRWGWQKVHETVARATSSPQSSWPLHHHASSWEVWEIGNAWIQAWEHSRARNPVFFWVKSGGRGRRRRVSVSAVSRLDWENWSTKCAWL